MHISLDFETLAASFRFKDGGTMIGHGTRSAVRRVKGY